MPTTRKKTSIHRKTRKVKALHYKISGPYVINLPHRKDRWSQFSKQADKLKLHPIRCNGVYHKDPYTGCLKAHINVLKQWSGEDAIWICEDDCEFKVNAEVLHKTIDAFMKSSGDVLCLAYDSKNQKHYNKTFDRTFNCHTAPCYLVKGHVVNILLSLWKHALSHRIKGTTSPLKNIFKSLKLHDESKWSIPDQCWKLLQQDFIFLIPKVRCAIQKKSFSDIQKKQVDYKL